MSTTATPTATATHQPGSRRSAVRRPSPRVHPAHVPAPTSRQPARGRIQLSAVPCASAMNDRDLALLGACWTSRRRLMLVNLGRLAAPSDVVALQPVQESDVAPDRGRGEWIKGVRYSLLEDLTAPTASTQQIANQTTKQLAPRSVARVGFSSTCSARSCRSPAHPQTHRLTNGLSFEQCPDRDGLPLLRQHPHRPPSPMSIPKPTGGPYLHFSYETSWRMPGEV
jgi:hypothetical protein